MSLKVLMCLPSLNYNGVASYVLNYVFNTGLADYKGMLRNLEGDVMRLSQWRFCGSSNCT